MKVVYGSDLHLEFYNTKIIDLMIDSWRFEEGTDMIIIAGDLHVGAHEVIKALKKIWHRHKIFIAYVPGNHEYYGSSFTKENFTFKCFGYEGERFYILNGAWFERNDITIVGAYGNIDGSFGYINRAQHGMLNDFHMIADFNTHELRGKSEYKTIKEALENNRNSKTIVITHTLPSPACIADMYKGDILNPCFANNWEDLILDYNPDIWICGHTHDKFNMMIGDTNVLCNCMGYPSEAYNFKWEYFNV